MKKEFLKRKIPAGIAFLFNIISACYIIFFAFLQDGTPFQTVLGLLIPAALLLNIYLVYINCHRDINRALKKWGTTYLIISIAAMILLPAAGFAASSVYEHNITIVIMLAAVYVPFLAVLLIGTAHSALTWQAAPAGTVNVSEAGKNDQAKPASAGKRKTLTVILTVFLLLGFFPAYILLSRYPGLLQVAVSPCALFLAFVSPALAILVLKSYGSISRPFSLAVTTVGLILMIIFMLPLFATPSTLQDIETDFKTTFGDNWRERIDPETVSRLRTTRFSLPGYFLGYFPGNYEYRKNILYYEGSDGTGEGLKLYYDLFRPLPGAQNLPGEGSTIIRIHGGAWVVGDKGASNMLQMNKHLASLGYTVFDIQYGLTDSVDFPQLAVLYNIVDRATGILPNRSVNLSIGAPDHLKGSFTLDDMMNHLGIFTDYLVENADELGASTESVFISGGSAGGHLSTALALAMSSGEYEDLFNPKIQVKGYIPYYPANRATLFLKMIGGADEWIDVENLIRPDSPPCLIFQGTNDGLVTMETARYFKESYAKANNDCCVVIYMPYAAHAADYLFSGYYSQIFLYYMERFMDLHR